jgi:hypothetical protein
MNQKDEKHTKIGSTDSKSNSMEESSRNHRSMHRRTTETLSKKETVQRAAEGSCFGSERVPEHGHIIRAKMLQ